MRSLREIQDEIAVQRGKIVVGSKLLIADAPDKFADAMVMIEQGYCEICSLHEELFPHLRRMEEEIKDQEEDESYDPCPGYGVGQ